MTMHKEDAEKVIRKAAEMLGVIPIYECRSCKNNGNERYCLDCHDHCNFVRYEERPQGKWYDFIDKGTLKVRHGEYVLYKVDFLLDNLAREVNIMESVRRMKGDAE